MLIRVSDMHIVNMSNVAEIVLDDRHKPFKIRMCNGDVIYVGEGWDQWVLDALFECSPVLKKQEGEK